MLSCVQKILQFMQSDERGSKSSGTCLLTFNLIVFEQMKRFVFPANFGFSAFLLGREKNMWGHWWPHFDVNQRP